MHGSGSFGAWVRQRRKQADLTQAGLAALVGCAVITIRKIEADALRPSRQVAERLADCLDVPATERSAFVSLARGEAQWPTSNLPAPTTPLIGRARERAQVAALVCSEQRLVTLIGAPGIGKTRLALQVATDLASTFADGAFFVPLAAVHDPALVLPGVAQALGLQDAPGSTPGDRLDECLRDRQVLLVLDNFEQVLAAAPQVVHLLYVAPRLKVLITSRSVLHLSGEAVYPVPPLALPDKESALSLDDLEQAIRRYPAIELFVARARAANPRFRLTGDSLRAVAAICAHLDGLPLAIELAAARCRLFAPKTLLARLRDQPALLAGGAQDLPVRQQTLSAALTWSYDLLTPAQQALFARLGVFVGGCSLPVIEAIGVAEGDAAGDLLDNLAALLDNSLLQQEPGEDEEPRFVMLQTVQAYALECLRAAGEEARFRERHARYYAELAEAAEPHIQGADQNIWLDRLDREHDNMRAALAWCAAAGDPQRLGLRLAAALWLFWQVRGHLREGRAWMERFLALAPEPTLARARALNGAGLLAFCQAEYDQAVDLIEASLGLCRELRDRHVLAHALNNLGTVALGQHDGPRAAIACSESLSLSRELGQQAIEAWALMNLGHVACLQHNYRRGLVMFEESLAVARSLQGERTIAYALMNLASWSLHQGADTQVAALLDESLVLFRKLDDRQGIAWALSTQGQYDLSRGAYQQAAALLGESLALLSELGNNQNLASIFSDLGTVCEILGDLVQARSHYTESLRRYRAAGDQAGIARALFGLGQTALHRHDYAEADECFEEYVMLMRQLADDRFVATGVCLRAVALARGDSRRCRVLLEEHLARFEADGAVWGRNVALHLLGLMMLMSGEYARAEEHYRRSLAAAQQAGDTIGISMRLAGLAGALLRRGRAEAAALFCGAAERMRAEVGAGRVAAAMYAADREQWASTLAGVQSRCTHHAVAAAWNDGYALSIEQVIAAAQLPDNQQAELAGMPRASSAA